MWSDEFDGTAVDLKKWQFEQNCNVQNNELQCYTARTQNARVANGKLSIIALVEDYGNKKFTSARLNTAKTASWLYGRFEMSAKLPRGKHLWPAFWMLPTDYKFGAWAASGEIDIMEYRGQETNITQGTLHFGGKAPNNARQGSGSVNMGTDLSAAYHTYAVEWERDEIRWYFDKRMYYKTTLNRSFWSGKGTNPYTANRQPFDQRFHFVINLAVGGNFFNAPQYGTFTTKDAESWPDNSFDIDYIRAYQWINGSSPATSASKAVVTSVSKAVTSAKSASETFTEAPTEEVVNLENNSQHGNSTKILGMTKPVVSAVFATIGVAVIVLVVVSVGLLIWYRRRASRPQTDLAVPGAL